jgi:molecular chaperone GrpE (heat shock protein)
VRSNKKEFVNKMLPIIDAFRLAPINAPAETEKEEKMHAAFGALLNGVMVVIEKFGFKEYSPAVGDKLDALRMQIGEVEEDGTEGLVIRTIKPGMLDAEGDVVRRSLVVASGTVKVEKGPDAIETDASATA